VCPSGTPAQLPRLVHLAGRSQPGEVLAPVSIQKVVANSVLKLLKIRTYALLACSGQDWGFGGSGDACFLRNTRPKNALRVCAKTASSLLRGVHSLMCVSATEGGIPLLCCPGFGSVSGEQGEVPSVSSHWADTEPSQEIFFGGSK
jgi:hypothetical protein